MPQLTPLSTAQLRTLVRDIGRAAIFYNADATDTSDDPLHVPGPAPLWRLGDELNLQQLGDTQGDVATNPNEQIRRRTVPELAGDAVFEARKRGGNVIVTAPLVLANPNLRRLISPDSSNAIGRVGEISVTLWTLWIVPHRLFLREDGGEFGSLRFVGDMATGGWELSYEDEGAETWEPLTATQERLLGQSIFIPAGFWTRPPLTYRDGTNEELPTDIEDVEFQSHVHPDFNGLAFQGDPILEGIDILGGS